VLTDKGRHLVALAVLLAGAASANLLWAGRAPAVHYHVDFRNVPLQVVGLQGAPKPTDQRIFTYLGADAMQEFTYKDGKRRVDLALVYGTDWRAVHSPLSCLPQQGWQVDEQRQVQLPAPSGCPHPGPINGQVLLAHKPDGREQLVLYVFAHKGGTSGDWVKQGWEVARQPSGSGGLMLLLSMPIARGDARRAQSLLEEVFGSVYVPATAFWYQ
jgi:hypothetical protein